MFSRMQYTNIQYVDKQWIIHNDIEEQHEYDR